MSDASEPSANWTIRDITFSERRPMVACEVCGKLVFVAWFSPWGNRKLKCGECATPRRAEVQRAFPDHDPGDEDRTVAPAPPASLARDYRETGIEIPRLSRREVSAIPDQARDVD